MDNISPFLDLIKTNGVTVALAVVVMVCLGKYGIYILKAYTSLDTWVKKQEEQQVDEKSDRKETIRILNDINISLKTLATKDDIIQFQNRQLSYFSAKNKDISNA